MVNYHSFLESDVIGTENLSNFEIEVSVATLCPNTCLESARLIYMVGNINVK